MQAYKQSPAASLIRSTSLHLLATLTTAKRLQWASSHPTPPGICMRMCLRLKPTCSLAGAAIGCVLCAVTAVKWDPTIVWIPTPWQHSSTTWHRCSTTFFKDAATLNVSVPVLGNTGEHPPRGRP